MSAPRPASLRLYGLATGLATPLAPLWLRARLERGKEDPARWRERLGCSDLTRPAGPLAWLHGASVGEGLSLLPLAEAIRAARPGVTLLVTTGTRASAEVLATRAPPGLIHQYAPLDTPGAVQRFLDRWRPDLAVFAESELWPNLILGARARGARLTLVSARLSDRSARGWARAPAAAAALLGAFDLVLARDRAAADTLERLGATVAGLADFKFGAPPLPAEPEAARRLAVALDGRPVILAASTHAGEDEILLAAFAAADGPERGQLILAPRHPDRGPSIVRAAREAGLTASLRSAGGEPGEGAVHVADTVGEMGLWYRLATLSIIGGSLLPGAPGGHNPLEPARLGSPVAAGPFTAAWPVYEEMARRGAVLRTTAADAAGTIARALAGDPALKEMAARARSFVRAGDAAASAAVERIVGLLPP